MFLCSVALANMRERNWLETLSLHSPGKSEKTNKSLVQEGRFLTTEIQTEHLPNTIL